MKENPSCREIVLGLTALLALALERAVDRKSSAGHTLRLWRVIYEAWNWALWSSRHSKVELDGLSQSKVAKWLTIQTHACRQDDIRADRNTLRAAPLENSLSSVPVIYTFFCYNSASVDPWQEAEQLELLQISWLLHFSLYFCCFRGWNTSLVHDTSINVPCLTGSPGGVFQGFKSKLKCTKVQSWL